MRNNILVKSHYYCPVCYISLDYYDDGALNNCPSCDKHFSYKELRDGGHYFVQIPLKQQLKGLLSGPLFSQDQITNIKYMQADKALRLFVEQIPSLYNLQFMKYNTCYFIYQSQ